MFAAPLAAQDRGEPPHETARDNVIQQVEAILAAAPSGVRFGLVVERPDGTRLVSISPTARFIPASNTKIYTTLAAFADIVRLQAAAQGTGVRIEPAGEGQVDVVLEGRGDATLSSAPDCTVQCLATLADAVAARSVRVRHVIGDATWYPDERWSSGMSWNNIPFRSGTGIAALSVDDNEIRLDVTPGAEGASPVVSGDGYFAIENRAISIAGDKADLSYWRMPGSMALVVSGTIGTATAPERVRLAVDDPAHRAAWQLARMLEQRGVKVLGQVLSQYRALAPQDDPQHPDYPAARQEPPEAMLAQLPAEDLAADITVINKVSQNVHAELMLRRVGRLSGTGSIASGQAAIASLAEQAGISGESFTLADGSGMSTYNRLSPDGTVAILRFAAQQEWGARWRGTLPVGGVDGTLARRFAGTALEGRIFAKTGSLNASRALSGYMLGASGELLTFSAFANDIPPDADDAAIAALDAALVAIAEAH
jgi:D-alanyl-D-alanine carboxypeptidase/D-alanyl-D-alanine-endopeptidase (penicillin-binding protein 4)